METIPVGLCQCGCGRATQVSERSDARRGWLVGQPRLFARGHNTRTGKRRPGSYVTQSRPGGTFTREHVLVAERALGHRLPPAAQVHHVNGDPSDNRSRNLVICQDLAYHKLLHRRLRALRACGHADWLTCWDCKAYFPRNEVYLKKSRTSGAICRSCSRSRRGNRRAA